jgi:hypothetical protein
MRGRRLEDAGDVFHVAGIDDGSVELDEHLSRLEIRCRQFADRQDRRRPVFFEAKSFHRRHSRSPNKSLLGKTASRVVVMINAEALPSR